MDWFWDNSLIVFIFIVVICAATIILTKKKPLPPKDALEILSDEEISRVSTKDVTENGNRYKQASLKGKKIKIKYWYDDSEDFTNREEICITVDGYHLLRVMTKNDQVTSWQSGSRYSRDLAMEAHETHAAMQLHRIIKDKSGFVDVTEA